MRDLKVFPFINIENNFRAGFLSLNIVCYHWQQPSGEGLTSLPSKQDETLPNYLISS